MSLRRMYDLEEIDLIQSIVSIVGESFIATIGEEILTLNRSSYLFEDFTYEMGDEIR